MFRQTKLEADQMPAGPALGTDNRSRRRTRRTFGWSLGLFVLLALILIGIVTDSRPAVGRFPPPSAEQVAVAREAVLTLRENARASGEPRVTRLSAEQMDAVSALSSHALEPDRHEIVVRSRRLYLRSSFRLPFHRWLNIAAEVQEAPRVFPTVQLQLGAIRLSPLLSRKLLDASVSLGGLAGIDLPPVEEVVSDFRIEGDNVAVAIKLDEGSGAISRILGMQSRIDASEVESVYCRIAAEQRRDPQSDFAIQVRRTFKASRSTKITTDYNKAAFVALAMMVADSRAGALAGVPRSIVERCPAPPTIYLLHGRSDLPKHWVLSAALAAGAGGQFAVALGEWKELADSLPENSQSAAVKTTGFSFVDIAADRAGYLAAQAAVNPGDAVTMGTRLSQASADDILPASLLLKREGLYSEFRRDFGGLEDPRYAEAIREIDRVLLDESVSRDPF